MSPGGEWEPEAENWVRWARTPEHDAFWYYREAFFNRLVPPPGRRTVEVGCGEGRVTRELSTRGHRVIGTDSSPTLVRYAREADSSALYCVADGGAVPLPDGSCELVVAYNSLQVVADMPGTVREAARILDSKGHLCVCVSHL
jgi:ubiquinone/menaquinone biosynthesis C-methylase UbiE